MEQFLCQCGCGGVGTISKHWRKSKGTPKYLSGHNLRAYYEDKPEKLEQKKLSIKFSDQLTSDQLDFVKKHKKMSRKECARILNIDKRLLNFVRIELGIHSKEA